MKKIRFEVKNGKVLGEVVAQVNKQILAQPVGQDQGLGQVARQEYGRPEKGNLKWVCAGV